MKNEHSRKGWIFVLTPLMCLVSFMLFDWYLSKEDDALSRAAEMAFVTAAEKIGAEDMILDVRCEYEDNWWIDMTDIKVEEIRRIETVKLLQSNRDDLFAQDLKALMKTLSEDYGMEFESIRFFVSVDRTYSFQTTSKQMEAVSAEVLISEMS